MLVNYGSRAAVVWPQWPGRVNHLWAYCGFAFPCCVKRQKKKKKSTDTVWDTPPHLHQPHLLFPPLLTQMHVCTDTHLRLPSEHIDSFSSKCSNGKFKYRHKQTNKHTHEQHEKHTASCVMVRQDVMPGKKMKWAESGGERWGVGLRWREAEGECERVCWQRREEEQQPIAWDISCLHKGLCVYVCVWYM